MSLLVAAKLKLTNCSVNERCCGRRKDKCFEQWEIARIVRQTLGTQLFIVVYEDVEVRTKTQLSPQNVRMRFWGRWITVPESFGLVFD